MNITKIGWNLFIRSDKQAWQRFVLSVIAIVTAVLMLLSLIAGINALYGRTQRSEWRIANFTAAHTDPIPNVDPILLKNYESNNLQNIGSTYMQYAAVKKTGRNSPIIPNLIFPDANEFLFSPALEKLSQQHPEYNLESRIGGKKIGVIPNNLLVSPNVYFIIRGMSDDEAKNLDKLGSSPHKIYSFKSSSNFFSSTYTIVMIIVFIVGAIGLLFPIILFLISATQLGSAQRERRYAALRLIGATRSQLRALILFETFLYLITGIVIGFILFQFCYPILEQISLNGDVFFAVDMKVQPLQYIITALVIICVGSFASVVSFARANISPLGIIKTQKKTYKKSSWVRILPLLVGVSIFAFIATLDRNWAYNNMQSASIALYGWGIVVAFLLILFGLILAGPFITRLLARLYTALIPTTTGLIAKRRIELISPRIFASVGGVVIALFVGTFYLASVSGIDKNLNERPIKFGYANYAENIIVIQNNNDDDTGYRQAIASISDIQKIITVQQLLIKEGAGDTDYNEYSIFDCKTLSEISTFKCDSKLRSDDVVKVSFTSSEKPIVTMDKKYTNNEVIVSSNSSLLLLVEKEKVTSIIEQIRSAVGKQDGGIARSHAVVTNSIEINNRNKSSNPVIKEFAQLAYWGICITLLIAIASLLISTLGSLIERKRTFFTLRQTGFTVGELKRIVFIETLLPFIGVASIATVLGVWIASIFLKVNTTSLSVNLSSEYVIVLFSSIIVSVLGITIVLSNMKKLVSTQENRSE